MYAQARGALAEMARNEENTLTTEQLNRRRRELHEDDVGIEIPDCGLRGITRAEREENEALR